MKFAVLAMVALVWLYLLLWLNWGLASRKGPDSEAAAQQTVANAGHAWPFLALMMLSMELYGHQLRFTPILYALAVLAACLQAIGGANGWAAVQRLGSWAVVLVMAVLSGCLAYQAAPPLLGV